MSEVTRRQFVKGTAASTAAASSLLLGTSKTSWAGANDKVRVATIGIRGRGREHISAFSDLENVEVTTLCDIDTNLFKDDRLKQHFDRKGLKMPKLVQDLREVMDDKDIDVVSVATPNHWHSLAGIWACQAGKDAYVEKPCSHNLFEGRQLSNAQIKYDRVVQHGTQIRSSKAIQEAIALLHDGYIGEVYMARGLCYRWRDTIGKFEDSTPPEGVDYNIWLGPAPERPFNENRFHYNWHYMWDYGNGDIGNQGVHQLDIARWGLGVELPTRVSTSSGMFIFDDQKEVPNVISTTYDYPDAGEQGKMLVFDVRPWMTNDEKGAKVGILFYGSKGYLVIDSYDHYTVYMGKDGEKDKEREEGGNHFQNFVDAVRARDQSILNAPILEGHYSAALAHLGLTSARLGRSLTFDPKTERFVNDDEANAGDYVKRNYRDPFVVPEINI